MVNLISTNALCTRKQFGGLFCNVEEAMRHGESLVATVCDETLTWKEVPEDSVMFQAFMIGTLLPARVLRAYYADSCLVLLDYDY
jgi:hypothetical protein